MSQDVTSNDSLAEINKVVAGLQQKNSDLTTLLSDAKLQLLSLRDQVEQLGAPPSGFGIFLDLYEKTKVLCLVKLFSRGVESSTNN